MKFQKLRTTDRRTCPTKLKEHDWLLSVQAERASMERGEELQDLEWGSEAETVHR
ncbi:MAG: hypothetical protein NTNFB02_35470 [Nitrospira sp.]